MSLVRYLLGYPWWWYVNRTQWWWQFFQATWPHIEARIALAALVSRPSAGLRSAQAILSLITVCVFGLVAAGAILLWWLWPLGFVAGFTQGSWAWLWGWLMSLTAFGLYWSVYVLQPKLTVDQLATDPDWDQLLLAASRRARQVLKTIPAAVASSTLLRLLVQDPHLQHYFDHLDVTDQQLLKRAVRLSSQHSQIVQRDQVISRAVTIARHYHHRHLTTVDLFLGLVQTSPLINQILADLDVWNAELDAAVKKLDAEHRQSQARKWWLIKVGSQTAQRLAAELRPRRPLALDLSSIDVLRERLESRIVGQTDAIQQLHSALRRAEGLPSVFLLMIGPGGVGKTEAVRQMAEHFFPGQPALGRIDMVKYQTAASARDCLTELADRLDQGQVVLLLDKLERAHPDVLSLLGQAMERGQTLRADDSICLLDHCLLIGTSNSGANSIRRAIEEGCSPIQIVPAVRAMLQQRRFPEAWLDQLHGLIVYKHLSPKEVEQAVALLVREYLQAHPLGAAAEVEADVVRHLVEQGYNPRYGLRPFDNLIRDRLEPVLRQQGKNPAALRITLPMVS